MRFYYVEKISYSYFIFTIVSLTIFIISLIEILIILNCTPKVIQKITRGIFIHFSCTMKCNRKDMFVWYTKVAKQNIIVLCIYLRE